ncbi:MAG: Asp-tRNA(Asn)/Glu-tRNA(Gln) amidotransferase subunit GatC [Akkermansiaceae bacterium]
MANNQTDQIDVRYVADLARINLSEDECKVFQEQLDAILGYIESLKNIDVEAADAADPTAIDESQLREDASRPSLSQQDLLRNAPESAMGQIRVPKVVDA